MSNIPNKIDHAMVAVYYDYESDYNGYYNLLLGARVSSLDGVPAGMVACHVPAQKSRVFVSESGQRSRVCVELWQKIWLLEDEHAVSRAYVADYELYDERSKNPHDGRVAICLGIK
jgi:predicted transcriptional regulator YdeE